MNRREERVMYSVKRVFLLLLFSEFDMDFK